MSDPSILGARASGVLLHTTSLPGPGIGDLGPSAYRFVDWLVSAGQSFWQILPLVPVDSGGSPYNGLSAMAGNPLLVSPEILEREGLLETGWAPPPAAAPDRVDYREIGRWKAELLAGVHARLEGLGNALRSEFADFRREHESWLPAYGLYRALREHHDGESWSRWPAELRRREPSALERWERRLAPQIERYAFDQFLFERQWRALRSYARERGIRIIGDIPIFVAYDSADVWSHPEIFQLDPEGRPTGVSGVPPDYFSATGQRWGNPLYRWDALRDTGYRWWVERFRRTLQLVDVVRVDHFRGFEAYWRIDAAEETAVNGEWASGPGADLFRALEEALGVMPVIAEDLGLITPEVERLRDELGYPGMRVLQFAFDGDPRNPHLPTNYPDNAVAYTGTHDNDTIRGWWLSVGREERRRVGDWLGGRRPDNWIFVQAVLASRAGLAIVPMQDVLGLGSESRTNTPGAPASNWTWRLIELPPQTAARRLRSLTEETGRLPTVALTGSEDHQPESR